jgi:ribulose-phosphate 3-epimerase
MQIIPTILDKQFEIAEEKIKLIKDVFKWIQIDVIDGFYMNEKTFEPELLNKTELNTDNNLWEMHLMVKEPIKWIEKCSFINASRIIGQIEMMSDREKFVTEVKNIGMEAGLGFDVDTPLSQIPEETDLVLLMARKAGFNSFEFDKKIYQKIEDLKKIKNDNNLNFQIGIDGGVNVNNMLDLKRAGIDVAYCGGTIFNGNVNDNLKKLYDAINQ